MQAICSTCSEVILLVGRAWVTRPAWESICPTTGENHIPKAMNHS